MLLPRAQIYSCCWILSITLPKNSLEAKYYARFLLKDMRIGKIMSACSCNMQHIQCRAITNIGANEITIITALARAFLLLKLARCRNTTVQTNSASTLKECKTITSTCHCASSLVVVPCFFSEHAITCSHHELNVNRSQI